MRTTLGAAVLNAVLCCAGRFGALAPVRTRADGAREIAARVLVAANGCAIPRSPTIPGFSCTGVPESMAVVLGTMAGALMRAIRAVTIGTRVVRFTRSPFRSVPGLTATTQLLARQAGAPRGPIGAHPM